MLPSILSLSKGRLRTDYWTTAPIRRKQTMIRIWHSMKLWTRLALIILAAIALAVAWYLGSPLFLNTTVNQSFPAAVAPARAQSADGPAAQSNDAASARIEAIAASSGHFGEIDSIHKGSGVATIFKLSDGKHVLRFEDFKVTNGPDLYVYLSSHPAPRDSGQLHEGTAFEVAVLKGNIGSQNYELPADLDLSQFKSVVIYCKRFSVVFSTAELVSGS